MAPFALGSLGVKSFPRHRSLLGALAFRALYAIIRTESLSVQKLFRSSFVLGAVAFKAFHVIVRNGAMEFRAPRVTGPLVGGNLGVKAVSVTGPRVGLRAHTNDRTGALV